MITELKHFNEILQFRAQNQADQIAYRFLRDGDTDEITLTYAELYRRARLIAAEIQSKAELNERVVLLYEPGLEFICCFYACLLAGVIAVPCYPPNPRQLATSLAKLELLIQDASPKLICCSSRVLTLLRMSQIKGAVSGWLSRLRGSKPESLRLTAIDKLNTESLHHHYPGGSIQAPSPLDVAYLQYTSGSTGDPKGVMVTHGNLISNSQAIKTAFRHDANSIGVIWLPPYHDMGLVGGILQPMFTGFTCVLTSPLHFIEQPLQWLRLIERYSATTSGGPNFSYALCSKHLSKDRTKFNLSSWQVAFCGAEPLNKPLLDQFSQRTRQHEFNSNAFYPCYGLAEHTLIATGVPYQAGLKTQKARADCARNIVSCGPVIPAHELIIVHPESLDILPDGNAGEIWLRGPSVARGYWQNDICTQATFHAYTRDGRGPFLRTGDLGFLQENELYVTGRIKDMLIIAGRNLAPQDVEFTAEQAHAACRPGCAVAFDATTNIAIPVAVVVVAVEIKSSTSSKYYDEILQAVTQNVLAEHSLMEITVLLLPPKSILKTTSGKVRRQASKACWQKNQWKVLRVSSKEAKRKINPKQLSPAEDWLQQHLPLALIHPGRTLVDCGLSSLQAIALQNWLQCHYNHAPALGFLLSTATASNLINNVKIGATETAKTIAFTQQSWSCQQLNDNALEQQEIKAWKSCWADFLKCNDEEIAAEQAELLQESNSTQNDRDRFTQQTRQALSYFFPHMPENEQRLMLEITRRWHDWHKYWSREKRLARLASVMPFHNQVLQQWVSDVEPCRLLLCCHLVGWHVVIHQLMCAFANSAQKLCILTNRDFLLREELSMEFALLHGAHHPVRKMLDQQRLTIINPAEENEHRKIQSAFNEGSIFIVMIDPISTMKRDDLYQVKVANREVNCATSIVDLLTFQGASVQTLWHHWKPDASLTLNFSPVHRVQKNHNLNFDMLPLYKSLFSSYGHLLTDHLYQWANLPLYADSETPS